MKKILVLLVALFMVAGVSLAEEHKGSKEKGSAEKGSAAKKDKPLKVKDAAVCTSVEDRKPVGAAEEFENDVEQLYFFTRVVGAKDETTVTHVWSWKGEEMASVDLKVGSANWRTYSSKNIYPGWVGDWKVEAKDADGNVLETVEFKIVSADDDKGSGSKGSGEKGMDDDEDEDE